MTTLETLCRCWSVDPSSPSPILLPNRSRKDLAKLFRVLGFRSGAEIGVALGVYSKMLCVQNPALHLLCIDNWAAYPAVPPDNPAMSQEQMDARFERARLRLVPFNVTIVRMSSVSAADTVKDDSLDFAFIDAGHTLADVIADIAAWTPKVREGGIIAGHDFTHERFNWRRPLTRETIFAGPAYKPCHVIEAVRAWTSCHQIAPWFVLDGLLSTASWMWIK